VPARHLPASPQCFRVIYTYMAFAVFDIYFIITSLVSLQVLKVRQLLPAVCLFVKS
jgi:hypothetical protein